MNFSMQCNKIIDNYLLNRNFLFKNRNILSLFIALLSAEYLKLTDVILINKFIIPICLYIVVMLLCEILITMVISNNERKSLKEKCMLWINDPENKNKRVDNSIMILDLNEIKNYVKTKESFDNTNSENLNSENSNSENSNSNNSNSNNSNNSKNDFNKELIQKVLRPNPTTYRNLKNPPIPGPQWRPDSAEEVQDRLSGGMYVNSLCPYN